MKRTLLVLLLLAVLLAPFAAAEPEYTYDKNNAFTLWCDLDADGFDELVEVGMMPVTDDGVIPIVLYVYTSEYEVIGDALLFEYAPGEVGYTVKGDVCLTENGNGIDIFAEFAQENIEMPESAWALFGVENGELVTRRMIRDFGYTNGSELCETLDSYSDEFNVVYSSAEYDRETYLAALDGQFLEWGLSFEYTDAEFEDPSFAATVVDEANGARVFVFDNDNIDVFEGDADQSMLTYYIYTTGSVHVRTEPDLNADQVTSMKSGDTADYLDEFATDDRGVVWYKVRFGGKEGWVSSKYAMLLDDYATGSGDRADGENPLGDYTEVVVTGNSINVRDLPELDGKSIGIMKLDDTASLMGGTSVDDRGVEWYQIVFKGGEGWVSSKYVKLR